MDSYQIVPYHHRFKVAGLIALALSTLYFGTALLLNLSSTHSDIALVMMTYSLFVVAFSKDKKEPEKAETIRYRAGVFTITVVISTVIAPMLVSAILGFNYFFELIDLAWVLIGAFTLYQIVYYNTKRQFAQEACKQAEKLERKRKRQELRERQMAQQEA